MDEITEIGTADLIAELQRRGALAEVGYCYPADGGGWQLIEMSHRLACEPQWPVFAVVPEWYRSQATQD